MPTLGFHFSPERYERLMAVTRTLFPLEEQADLTSLLGAPSLAFSKRDHAGKVQVLTWTVSSPGQWCTLLLLLVPRP